MSSMKLVILLALLQVIDIITTSVVLNHGGTELNPLMACLIEKFGTLVALISVKSLVIGILFIGVYLRPNVDWIRKTLCITCFMYVILMIHNLIAMASYLF